MPVRPDIIRSLRQAALFKDFTENGLQIIASIAVEKQIPAGTPLFVESMLGDGLYVVVEGRLRLSLRRDDGAEVELASVGPGESLGEAALLRSGPRLCSATAEVDSQVLEISRRDLATLQRSKPQACLKLMMGVVACIGDGVRASQSDLRKLLVG